MHTSILKLIYNERLYVSANHVAMFRATKYEGEIQ
jgi:hypothetical protein